MTDTAFTYKGKKVKIQAKQASAVIDIDGRKFDCHHHVSPEGRGLSMWMCGEAYFGSPDIRELARHFADYGYMFDDPGRVIVDDDGKVVSGKSGKKTKSGGGR